MKIVVFGPEKRTGVLRGDEVVDISRAYAKLIGEVATRAGDPRAPRARRMKLDRPGRVDQLFAAHAVSIPGIGEKIVERRLGVIERPIAALDETPELGRDQRSRELRGAALAVAFADELGVGAADVHHLVTAQHAGSLFGTEHDNLHRASPMADSPNLALSPPL